MKLKWLGWLLLVVFAGTGCKSSHSKPQSLRDIDGKPESLGEGKYFVRCKDGSAEIKTLPQLEADDVCVKPEDKLRPRSGRYDLGANQPFCQSPIYIYSALRNNTDIYLGGCKNNRAFNGRYVCKDSTCKSANGDYLVDFKGSTVTLSAIGKTATFTLGQEAPDPAFVQSASYQYTPSNICGSDIEVTMNAATPTKMNISRCKSNLDVNGSYDCNLGLCTSTVATTTLLNGAIHVSVKTLDGSKVEGMFIVPLPAQ